MNLTFLNRSGEVVNLTLKQLSILVGRKVTWEKINNANLPDSAVIDATIEVDFLNKYGLNSTIFNVANLRLFGHVQLPKYYIDVVLKQGATDRRGIQLQRIGEVI